MKPRFLKLNYPQDKFIFSKHKYPVIKGTWGCGKSLAALIAVDKECQEYNKNLYLVIRKEFTDLRDSTMKDWNDLVGRPITNNDVKYPNGSTLMFRHGDDINALKNANLGGALMIQGEEMTEEDFWFLNGRLRRKEGSRQLRIECNYDGHNWIYNLFNQQKLGDLILTNTFDNEVNLPPDYIPTLKKMPEIIQKRHLYGSDDVAEGLVWPEFDLAKHTCDSYEFPAEWKETIGLDHGHNHPTAVMFGACNYDGKLIIYNEHYEPGQLISYHADKIKAMEPSYESMDRIIDHTTRYKTMQNGSRVYSILEAYQEAGISFRPSIADANAGIQLVAELFKQDKIVIFKDKCPNLIEEIGQWKWKARKPGHELGKEEAIRVKDDACKALIYLCSGRQEPAERPKTVVLGMTADILDQYERQQHGEEQVA